MRKLAGFVVALVMGMSSPSFADAVLTAIHGIPGLPEPVTVTANGNVLGTFDFNQALGPLTVPAGSYDIEVLLGGVPVDPLTTTVTLTDGVNYTAVAHLTESGAIKLSLFYNNVANLACWNSRLTVRHTAQAPEVDVELRRITQWWYRDWQKPFLKALGVANTDDGGAESFGPVDIQGGRITAVLFAAGTNTAAAQTPIVRLKSSSAYVVYAIGALGGQFTFFVQEIPLGTH